MKRNPIVIFCLISALIGVNACAKKELKTDAPVTTEDSVQINTEKEIQMDENKPWTIEYAMQVSLNAVSPSGDTYPEDFKKLENKSNQGDKNAMFAYAYSLNLLYEATRDEQFFRKALPIIKSLEKSKHPATLRFISEEYFKFGNEKWIHKKGMTREMYLKEVETNFRTAVSEGVPVNEDLGKLLSFGNKAFKEGSAYNSLLSASNRKNHEKMKEAVAMFKVAAEKGSFDSGAYLAEAYFFGIGVPKDVVSGVAWAKLISERYYETHGKGDMKLQSANKIAKRFETLTADEKRLVMELHGKLQQNVKSYESFFDWQSQWGSN